MEINTGRAFHEQLQAVDPDISRNQVDRIIWALSQYPTLFALMSTRVRIVKERWQRLSKFIKNRK